MSDKKSRFDYGIVAEEGEEEEADEAVIYIDDSEFILQFDEIIEFNNLLIKALEEMGWSIYYEASVKP